MKSIFAIAAAALALTFGACATKSCPAEKSSCCSSGGASCDAHAHAKKK
jgi:hypothetical protein